MLKTFCKTLPLEEIHSFESCSPHSFRIFHTSSFNVFLSFFVCLFKSLFVQQQYFTNKT
uniref:Uncharacterized protein n=1 Tax=Octopus bimaculoides TaxID=37653 RepID=A0A0L8HBW1_OCTBM